ncbi:dihydrofolate reductase family protein [Actinomadura madurae]|uniref:dihydrofolate reductase family protein n=1 Tax=Actinomadura madurae TaxID=1993 RepID=UPI00202683A8|nr:dihydrofolate reductase family protein [Actinomadura madurae]MCP9971791.1 dihydrofolate reductase family protein [Actinomadura madurae]MCP9984298.1 dihydrofolate reductase family protein [Actinomadura madurae]MCQ0004154.1 dihydrofolate reductase family protein [Actinomadura madurae]MCQ0020495.1 dihydrofolate reductase family protein [Actinomadura madurae]URN00534.1 dihydrofolate reductase family protein [Actinomadura madurae]
MRKLVYYVGVSIDGYIAGPADEVDFYPVGDDMAAWINERYPETVPTHVRPQAGLEDAPNKRFDTLIMGLGTYRPALDIGVTSPYAHVRQYVASTSLEAIDDPGVELVREPLGTVRELKAEQGDKDIWLAGGGRLAAVLLPEIDELIVKSYPVVAGAGIPAFAGEFRPALFTPERRESFGNGAQVTWFSRSP